MRRHLLPSPGTVRAGVLAAVLTALLGVVLTAGPAWAHTRLVASTPSQGAPAEAPGEVVLTFSEPVQPSLSAVSVTGADGQEHVSGAPSPGADDGSVSQALRAPLGPGTYRVAYRVLAADGHPVTGSFDVTAVAPADAGSSPVVATPTPDATTGPLRPAADERTDDGGPPVLPLAVGGLVVAGAVGLLARRLGGAPPAA